MVKYIKSLWCKFFIKRTRSNYGPIYPLMPGDVVRCLYAPFDSFSITFNQKNIIIDTDSFGSEQWVSIVNDTGLARFYPMKYSGIRLFEKVS